MRPLLLSLAAWFSLSPSARAADGPDTDKDSRAILLRAIKAHGGDKLARLRIVREQSRGTVTILDTKVPFTQETLIRMPDQFRVSQDWEAGGKKVRVVQVFDGVKARTVVEADSPLLHQLPGLRPGQIQVPVQPLGQGLAGVAAAHHKTSFRHRHQGLLNSLSATRSGKRVAMISTSAWTTPPRRMATRPGRITPSTSLKSL